jgi:uncharacterized protein (DUF4415 family)
MKKRSTIVRYDPKIHKGKGLTDWAWLDKATEADIDFSEIPRTDEEFWKNAVVRMPKAKKMVSIRIDEDVITWYKQQGPGYQTRINAVLKAYMQAA